MDKIVGFLVRFMVIALIMFAFYNPFTWNYVDWVFPNGTYPLVAWFGEHGLQFVVGLILVGALIYLCRFTYHGLGRIGVAFVAAILVAIVGTLAFNLTSLTYTGSLVVTVLQLLFTTLFAIGLMAAQINRRFAGQVTTLQTGDPGDHAHHST